MPQDPERLLYVLYIDYGGGMTFHTGPLAWRERRGTWAFFYRRRHPLSCSCANCCERIAGGPVDGIPYDHIPGRLYSVAH